MVALYNTFQDERRVYMLMEIADGGELYAQLAIQSAFPTSQVSRAGAFHRYGARAGRGARRSVSMGQVALYSAQVGRPPGLFMNVESCGRPPPPPLPQAHIHICRMRLTPFHPGRAPARPGSTPGAWCSP